MEYGFLYLDSKRRENRLRTYNIVAIIRWKNTHRIAIQFPSEKFVPFVRVCVNVWAELYPSLVCRI